MRCPKCGYISFDSNLDCPKCRSDISMEQSKLHLPSFKPSPPFFLGNLVGNEAFPLEEESAESFDADESGPAIREGDAAESFDGKGAMIIEEEFSADTARELRSAYDSFAQPSYSIKHIEEIKDLISELMPAKSDVESGKKKG
jgi:hypothetical protein